METEIAVDWKEFWQKKGLECKAHGLYVSDWEFCPQKNPIARELAAKILEGKGIKNACITEVAPALFWYQINEMTGVCSWIEESFETQCEDVI